MSNASRDQNRIPTMLAVSYVDGSTVVPLWADPVTHRLLVSAVLSTLTSDLNANNFRIIYLATPIDPTDAVNKQYVDSLIQGLKMKDPVTCATTANITLSGLQTIDGYAVQAGDRVLVKNQTTASQNGIYTAATGSWIRGVDMDVSTEFVGAWTLVDSAYNSIVNKGKAFICSNTTSPVVGTDSITFTPLFTPVTYSGGTGISIDGANVISIDSTVATLLGVQLLENKSLKAPVIKDAAGANLVNGIVKVVSGVPTIAAASDFPTLNQNTTGNAATATTAGSATTAGTATTLVPSATLITPSLGVATATSINKVVLTTPATVATLTIIDGKTLTVNNTLTFAGTDGNTITFPNGNDTAVMLTASQVLTGKTIKGGIYQDANGNTSVGFTTTASAVNYPDLGNSAAGNAPTIAAKGSDANIDLNIASKGTGIVKVNGVAVVDLSTAQTQTNKRIQPRTSSQASASTLTPDISSKDKYYQTAQAVALTIANPTGTPALGEKFFVNILDNGTARAISFGTAYYGLGIALPTTTVVSKWMQIACEYDGTNWATSYINQV